MNFARIFCSRLIFKEFFLTLIVASFTLLWFSASVAATEPTSKAQNDQNDLWRLLGGIKTMQANFVQITVGNSKGKTAQMVASAGSSRISGTMALERPGKFRWEALSPMHQLIVANDNRVWIYDADLEQVTKQTVDTTTAGNPAQLLSGDDAALRNTFVVTHLDLDSSSTAAENCFALQPKGKNNVYHKVKLCFSGDKLSSMTMEDNLGQNSRFQFSKVVINANIAPSLFVFKVPKGVDVIDNL